jgi:hypothetical protein
MPLGLPKGSVRAILALGFAVGSIGLVAYSVIRGDGDIPAALAALLGMTGIIVNSYFEKRTPTE